MAAPGVLLVVSSPSGAGKTTLCRRLVDESPNLSFSVSYTTRKAREGERDGVDYHFVDDASFQRMIDGAELAEWAIVHGHRYGTGMPVVREVLDAGRDVIFDIDYQGGRQIRSRFGASVVMVFILPPSIDELERRLRSRATDTDEVIERRLAKAREELEHYSEYDYLVVNDDITQALTNLRAVYRAAQLKSTTLAERAEFLLRGWRS